MNESFSFGTLPDGRPAQLYRLSNGNGNSGLQLAITDYGARLAELKVADRSGMPRDIVLGFPNLAGYVADTACVGAVLGRNANRIEAATFTLDGKPYQLAQNQGGNNLHSGPDGFENRLWELDERDSSASTRLTLRMKSPEGDQGFPGALDFSVTYEVLPHNILELTFRGTANRPTVLNPTTHTYFNLDGVEQAGRLSIENQSLKLCSQEYYYVDSSAFIPRGRRPVAASAFDFRKRTQVSAALAKGGDQFSVSPGFNHAFAIDGASSSSASQSAQMQPAAEVHSPTSGITMSMETDFPTVLLYTADYCDGAAGKYGQTYGSRAALCLEPGFVPNAVNMPGELQPILKPGVTFERHVRYKFSVD